MQRRVAPQLLLCLALGAARPASAQLRSPVGVDPIVGGQVVGYDPTSATALIGDCDATLISPEYLLTAAHCVVDGAPTQAWFGPSMADAELSVAIVGCEAHPEYPGKDGTDIAYCELADVVSEITPARLGCNGDPPAAGTDLVLRAHGYTTAAQREARVERVVEVRVDSVQAEGRELVVGNREHGACHGDSGGSAFARASDGGLELLGVISRRGPAGAGEIAEDCASSTVVTRVAPHVEWLAQRVGVFSSLVCAGAALDASDGPRPSGTPEDEPFTDTETTPHGAEGLDAARAGPSTARGCAVAEAAPPALLAPLWPWTVLAALAFRRLRARGPTRNRLRFARAR